MAASVRSQTPPSSGFFLAMWFANFASVFVGPMPTQVGIPRPLLDCRAQIAAEGGAICWPDVGHIQKLSSIE